MKAWPFLGREGELAAIDAGFAGSDVDSVVLAGLAGVGKTALARAALARLAGGGRRAEWVAGTRAGASVAFGAVAHLVPAGWRPTGEPLGVLRAVGDHVGGWGGRDRVVIGVDDAHLLDDSSLTAVTHLISGRLAFVVLTVRTGEPVADAVTALWKEGHAQRLELDRLPAEAMDRLLDHTLGGAVDGLSRRRVHEAAAGNPLALRELLRGWLADGVLRRRHGIWRLDPGPRPGGRVAELVAHRLVGLDEGTRLVLELVAAGEPVALAALERLAGPAAIRTAEESGLVVVELSGARVQARLAHPLYGEVLRSGTPLSRSRLVRRGLAAAILDTPMRRRDDALRAAQWQVDGGQLTRPDVVRLGARQAIGWANLALAERLARAARDAAPGPEADRLLAEVLEYRGRNAEAVALLADSPPPAGPELVPWATTRAETLYWSSGDVAAAERVLDTVAGQPGDEVATGSRSWILFFDGRCQAAMAAAREVLDRPDAQPIAVIWAAAAGTACAAYLGRPDESEVIHERGRAVAQAARDTLPWGRFQIGIGACLAAIATGDLRRARRIADDGYRAGVASGVPMMVSGWALFRGLVTAFQGHLEVAGASLREAVAGFEEDDTFKFGGCCTAALAGVAALRADAAEAGRWLEETDRRAIGTADAGPNLVFASWTTGWRAWSALAGGELANAAATARRAVELAERTGAATLELAARYDLLRLTSSESTVDDVGNRRRMRELAGVLGSPFATAVLTAADGLAGGDGTALAAAAAALDELGQDLLAAEAATVAARLLRRAGQRGRAALAQARAAALRARCPEARTPLLRTDDVTELLTPREREILLLAARHSSRQIADRLGLAVATVNNNLARAYAKLGITGRADIRGLLGPISDQPGQH